jgi:MoaA/NifB/PqqE/SkfB family radical SAM enzyme
LYEERRLRPDEVEGLWGRIEALIRRYPGVLWRADCGLIPLLSEGPLDPQRLQTFAIRGCQGGTALKSVDVAGKSHPCSFLPEGGAPERVLAQPCAGCSLQAVCRGGCLAVARAAGMLLDPECPKVLRAGLT